MPMIKWLSVTDRFTKMYLDRQFIPLGINSSQHMYILKICQSPGITQEQFISSFHLNPSNITRSILTLEKKGFLIRKTNPTDKRTCMLYPTSKAEAICGPIQKIIEQWENQILQNFCDEEQQLFLSMLRQIGETSMQLYSEQSLQEEPYPASKSMDLQ